MFNLIFAIFSQVLPFLPLAIGISTSYTLLKATDLSLDGSYVLGAILFSKFLLLGYSPLLATIIALLGGALVGVFVSYIQKGGRVDPLLAGVLVVFILTSVNLIILGKPNVSLLTYKTMFSNASNKSQTQFWFEISLYCFIFAFLSLIILKSRFGLTLRALGNNPKLLVKIGYPLETIRAGGFAFTNMLAAASGILTCQIYGYADIGMGLGMTLTGICAILIGQQFLKLFFQKGIFRTYIEFLACLTGVVIYFAGVNILLRFDINPIYLKMFLGFILIFFLRAFPQSQRT